MIFYRYDDDYVRGFNLSLYHLHHETSCYWHVQELYRGTTIGRIRRIPKKAKCPYAHPGIQAAKEAYVRRKESQAKKLQDQLYQTLRRLHGMREALKVKELPHTTTTLDELARRYRERATKPQEGVMSPAAVIEESMPGPVEQL